MSSYYFSPGGLEWPIPAVRAYNAREPISAWRYSVVENDCSNAETAGESGQLESLSETTRTMPQWRFVSLFDTPVLAVDAGSLASAPNPGKPHSRTYGLSGNPNLKVYISIPNPSGPGWFCITCEQGQLIAPPGIDFSRIRLRLYAHIPVTRVYLHRPPLSFFV